MSERTYLSFDLRIEPWGDGYRALVVGSPVGGGAAAHFTTLTEEAVPPAWGDITEIRSFGQRLFDSVFDGEVRSFLRQSQEEARRRGSLGLRIRLQLSDVPELGQLPWEYLYDPTPDNYLCLSKATPVVRYLDLPQRIQPLAVKPPLKVLVMIASPEDQPAVDADGEWARLSEAVQQMEPRGRVVLERIDEASLNTLQGRLRRGKYHVFHYIGHGIFDEGTQEGALLLEGEGGRSRPVSGQVLGTLLHDEPTLRLALLSACEGARASRSDSYAGVAQSLLRQGIPAVVAMQFPITDEAARTLAREFYAALAEGNTVDAALGEARKAIYVQGNEREWATPVLYLRAPDGRIFDQPPAGEGPAAGGEAVQAARQPITRVRKVAPPSLAAPAYSGEGAAVGTAELCAHEREVQDIGRQLERGRLILFVGADLPEAITGLPGRQALANALAAREGIVPGRRLADVAQEVMGYGSRWEFTDFLQEALDTVGRPPQPLHQGIVALVRQYQLETIVTTAYDDLLELAFQEAGIGLNPVVRDDQIRFIRPDRTTLISLYGHWRQADTLVVTEQDQNALLRGRIKRDLVDEVRHAFRRNSILFLGHDLSDPAVSALFDELVDTRSQLPSFAVWSGLSERERAFFEGQRNLRVLDVDPVALVGVLAG